MSGPLGTEDVAYERPAVSKGDSPTVNTFNFTTYDEANRLGGVLCLNSLPGDSTMWRHGVMVFHPSGDLLLSKGFGRDEGQSPFGTANLRITCEEPFRRWRLHYDGFVQQNSPGVLRDRIVSDGADLPMSFDLLFEAIVPAWGHVLDAVTGFHYEQNGRVSGWWQCADERYDYEGVGFRDRILGPKDTSKMHGHDWFNGVMPNGDAFFLTVSTMKDDPSIRQGSACVFVDGEQHGADIVDLPMWERTDDDPAPVEVTLKSPAGEHTIRLEPVQSSPWTYISHPQARLQPALFGHDRARSGSLLLWESAARVTWDGATGWGHVEQSLAVP